MPIIALVLASVTLAALKVGTILDWGNDIFLFGSKLTLASLGDLQWYLFGAMLMLTLPGALVIDKHVRVDLLRQRMSDRGKRIVDGFGSVFLLLPFAGIMAWHGFALLAVAALALALRALTQKSVAKDE
jgi:TRAP-type mannitol/chloroaromatic compound transport system permease small subunit